MNRSDFVALWSSPKSIVDEVSFTVSKQCDYVYEFDHIKVLADFPSDVWLHGSYSCQIGAVVYSFRIEGLGPIARYCIGGPQHGNAGRYHFHFMTGPSDIRQNLPHVEQRLDMCEMTQTQIWHRICSEANITHTDRFYDPQEMCA